jgi:hypothetical protein
MENGVRGSSDTEGFRKMLGPRRASHIQGVVKAVKLDVRYSRERNQMRIVKLCP